MFIIREVTLVFPDHNLLKRVSRVCLFPLCPMNEALCQNSIQNIPSLIDKSNHFLLFPSNNHKHLNHACSCLWVGPVYSSRSGSIWFPLYEYRNSFLRIFAGSAWRIYRSYIHRTVSGNVPPCFLEEKLLHRPSVLIGKSNASLNVNHLCSIRWQHRRRIVSDRRGLHSFDNSRSAEAAKTTAAAPSAPSACL